MPGPAVALGLSAAARGFSILSDRRNRRRQADALRERAEGFDTLATAERAGRQSESLAQRGVVADTLSSLTDRNVLQSSFAAPEIAEAVSPFEQIRRQRELEAQQEGEDLRLAANQTEAGAPGLEDFLGGTAGEAGEFLALKAGLEEQRKRNEEQRAQTLLTFAQILDPNFTGNLLNAIN